MYCVLLQYTVVVVLLFYALQYYYILRYTCAVVGLLAFARTFGERSSNSTTITHVTLSALSPSPPLRYLH